MPQTHDTPELRIPSLFWHPLRYPSRLVTGEKVPVFERTTTNESEPPYRRGHAVALRLWPTSRAIVIGWWGASQAGADEGESVGLARALGGEVMFGTPVTTMAGWRRPAVEDDDDIEIELPDGVTLEEHHGA